MACATVWNELLFHRNTTLFSSHAKEGKKEEGNSFPSLKNGCNLYPPLRTAVVINDPWLTNIQKSFVKQTFAIEIRDNVKQKHL